MKDLLDKLIPSGQKHEGVLPKYSAKKRNKLITAGVLSAIAITVGIYLFILYNPLNTTVASRTETSDIAFVQFHKEIKTGNRKGIIEGMSKSFQGGPTRKQVVLKTLESLKGVDYKIKIDSSVPNGSLHSFTYTITVGDKSVTLTDEVWQKNPEEDRWLLQKEGNGLENLVSLVAADQNAQAALDQNALVPVLYELEKVIPEGVSVLASVKHLQESLQKIKNTAFYGEFSKIVKKNGVSDAEFALVEETIVSLFGENAAFAKYGSSNNFLVVSRLSGPAKILSPIAEKVFALLDDQMKVTSAPFRDTNINEVTTKDGKFFYAFTSNFLHVSDSELLVKNSIGLASESKEGSIINDAEVFSFLSGLRTDYKYYFLAATEEETKLEYFDYGYLDGNVLKFRSFNKNPKQKVAKNLLLRNDMLITGSESFFALTPENAYGFVAFSTALPEKKQTKKKGEDTPDTDSFERFATNFEENSGIPLKDIFNNKMLLALLSGSGNTVGDIFLPVMIVEAKPNTATKAVDGIAKINNLIPLNEAGVHQVTINVAPSIDILIADVNNNLVFTFGKPALDALLQTSTGKNPNILSSSRWKELFDGKESVNAAYYFDANKFNTNVTEVFARGNVNPLAKQKISKRDALEILSLSTFLNSVQGKLVIDNDVLVERGSLVLQDIEPERYKKEIDSSMRKSDIDLQQALARLTMPAVAEKVAIPGVSSQLGAPTLITTEREISGFVYSSTNKRDPFTASYLVSQADYDRDMGAKMKTESLHKEMEQETTRLTNELLKPMVLDALFLEIVKANDLAKYNDLLHYAQIFRNDTPLDINEFEKRKSDILAYNELYKELMNRFQAEYFDRNKLPQNPLNTITLKGVATGTLGSRALVDAGGRGYFISEGDYIGSDFYLVSKITSETVALVKKSFDYKLTSSSSEQILSVKQTKK